MLPHSHTDRPNVASTLWIITQLELERLFASRIGWLYLSAFGFFWYVLLRYVIFNISSFLSQQNMNGHDWSGTVFSTYFNVGLYVFPLLCIFIAANQTGADRERGTLRFIMLRCNRASLFFGRFLSQVLIQCILIAATLLSTLAVVFYNVGFSLLALSNALIMAVNLGLVLLPFIAMMSLLSAVVKSPRQASLIAGLIWGLATAIITGLSHYFPFLEPLKMIVPGMQFDALTDLEGAAMFSLSYIPILQCAVLLTAGHYVMKRASL